MAELDPSIIMGYKPIQVEDPIQRKLRQTQLAGAQMEMQQQQQAQQEAEGLKNLLSGGNFNPDNPQDMNKLLGYGKAGAAIGQTIYLQKKAQNDARRTQLDMQQKYAQKLWAFPDQAPQIIQQALNDGVLKPEEAAMIANAVKGRTPEQIKQLAVQFGVSIGDQMRNTVQEKQLEIAQQNADTAQYRAEHPSVGGATPAAAAKAQAEQEKKAIAFTQVDRLLGDMSNIAESLYSRGKMRGANLTPGQNATIFAATTPIVGNTLSKMFDAGAQGDRGVIESKRSQLLYTMKNIMDIKATSMNSEKELETVKSMFPTATDTIEEFRQKMASVKAYMKDFMRRVDQEYAAGTERQIVGTGTEKSTGRKVVKYSDGTIEYAN